MECNKTNQFSNNLAIKDNSFEIGKTIRNDGDKKSCTATN